MIAWFARHSVAANLLMVTVVLLGAYSLLQQTTVEIFPQSDPDTISITIPLRGATPEDAELGLAARVEEALQGLEGIDRVVSTAVEGSATVMVEVDQDYDPREVLDEVKARVDAINTFPADAERPIVRLAQWVRSVISVVVAGPYGESEVRALAEQVRDDLLRIEGISQVDLDGVRDYEIAIEASQDRLREFDLTLADLASAIRTSSLDQSGGNLRTSAGDILLRSKGQAYRQDDFEAIVVKTNPDGSIIRVGDVARVDDGFQEDAVRTVFNGQSAAMIDVGRVGSESALEIAAKVRDYVDSRQGALPRGMLLGWWDDDSQVLKKRLGVLGSSAIQGSILVIVLLTLFLRPTIAFWVFIGIPISFLGAFTVMGLLDISLNLMSAFGFIVVLGIVVDDAIVTGEAVYRRLKSGERGIDASVKGTLDVAVPVTFGVLTTMVAFMPLAFIEGRMGSIVAPVAAVVVSVLIFSLIESKLVLPAHLKNLGVDHDQHDNAFTRWQRRFADGFENLILRWYRPALAACISHRGTTLAVFVGVLLVVLAMIASGWMRFTFFPRIQSETITASLTMPVGTQFEVTDRHVQRMLAAAQELRAEYVDPVSGESVLRHVLASTGSRRGSQASHYGRVQVELTPPEERSIQLDTADIVAAWRERIGQVPGAESLTFRADLFRAGDPIDVQLLGNNLQDLSAVADRVKAQLRTYPTVFEIADSLSDGKEELRIDLTAQGHVLGLTRSAVIGQVGQAFKGFEAQRVQRGRDDVRVLVRLPMDERRSLETLNDMLISAPGGLQVPLAHVAVLEPGRGPARIQRIDGFRTVNVTADVQKAQTNMTVLQADLRAYMDELLVQYPGVSYELEGEAREQRESFGSLQWGIAIVLFGIYCLLALPLRSYGQPLIVMSIIPFGLIGAVGGHWVMGKDLSFLSTMGMLALVGVVVNDSLVLVDYVNQRRRAGATLHEAVLEAGVVRFRPVMLTSLTTFFGLAPLLADQSTTSQFLIPMAISLGFGMLFATLITLVLVPVNLLLAEDAGRALRRWFGMPPAAGVAAGSG